MGAGASLLSLLVPPLCVACSGRAASPSSLCLRCAALLEALEPPPRAAIPGIDAAGAAVPHEGVGRELVAALKFRRLLAAAEPMAGLIAQRMPASLLAGRLRKNAYALVSVPAAPSRSLRRGFDPAEEIARRLAAITGLRLQAPLRRASGPPQVGRTRKERVADPPRIWAQAPVAGDVLLVDDVQTTGATLRACARALRDAGCGRVAAVTFARTL